MSLREWACIRLIPKIMGSNSSEGMGVRVLGLCCVGSGFCDGLITRSQEPYRVTVSI